MNRIPLKYDVSRNAQVNRLMELFERAQNLSLSGAQEARLMRLMLEVAKEINAMQGFHSHTVNHGTSVKVEIMPWEQVEANAPAQPIALQEPQEELPPVIYTNAELLSLDPDQEHSPPSQGTIWDDPHDADPRE